MLPPNTHAQRLPKEVRWNEGSDAEPFMRTAFQTVFFELMQLCKAIRLVWLVRRILFCVHVNVKTSQRALLRESHNVFFREDPKALERKIHQRCQLSGIVFRYPTIERDF